MTDTMIKVALFLGDHGEKLLLRELIAEKEREVKQERLRGWLEGHCVGCKSCEPDALWCHTAIEKQTELGKET